MHAGLLGRSNSLTSQEDITSDVLSAMVTMLASTQHKRHCKQMKMHDFMMQTDQNICA